MDILKKVKKNGHQMHHQMHHLILERGTGSFLQKQLWGEGNGGWGMGSRENPK